MVLDAYHNKTLVQCIILEQDANRKMGRNYTSTDDEHLINLSVGSDNRPLISHLNTIYGTTNIDLKNYNHTIQLNLHNNKKPITVTIHAKPANVWAKIVEWALTQILFPKCIQRKLKEGIPDGIVV